MVERITGGKPLPAELLDQIVAKTDGVPLFIEELAKTVLESGMVQDSGDHFTLTGPLSDPAIPATLEDSLMARLVRLTHSKEIAQLGAVIGRSFSHKLLTQVAAMSDDRLRVALDELVGSELVHRRGVPPAATYLFKHALIQDTVYQSLLKSRRQQPHTRIAEVLGHASPRRLRRTPKSLLITGRKPASAHAPSIFGSGPVPKSLLAAYPEAK